MLLDLAIRARPDQLDRLLERAEELDLLDLHAVEDVLDRAGGHRGRGRLRRALALFWPELRFAVELDLYETHGTRAAFERDRVRQEELKLLGIEMIRVTKPRLDREPDAVLRNLATLLERRRREQHSW